MFWKSEHGIDTSVKMIVKNYNSEKLTQKQYLKEPGDLIRNPDGKVNLDLQFPHISYLLSLTDQTSQKNVCRLNSLLFSRSNNWHVNVALASY